jgi:putative protein-disulfide isomerase
MNHFIYIADPMCSWCYGFAPQLTALREAYPDCQVDVLVGGLRANNLNPVGDELRGEIRGHWERVHQLSGLPFAAIGESPLDDAAFVYNTEPACRAVVCVRYAQEEPNSTNGVRALDYFHALQIAWYRDGRDITQTEVLADIAEELGLHRESFISRFNSDEIRQFTEQDFMICHKLGVRGFPTVIGMHNGEMHLVTSGYHTFAQMQEIIEEIGNETPAAGQASDAPELH